MADAAMSVVRIVARNEEDGRRGNKEVFDQMAAMLLNRGLDEDALSATLWALMSLG